MKYWRRFWRRKPKIDLTNIVLLLLAIAFIRTFLVEIVILGSVVLTLWVVVRLRKLYYQWQLSLDSIDELTPYQFEDYVGNLFRAKGYRVKVTRRSRDWGADVIAYSRSGERIAVQVKHSKKDRPISLDAVQQVFTSTARYKCNRAIVVTNSSSFTNSAHELARDAKVELWDRERLAREMAATRQTAKGSPLVQLVSAGIGGLKFPLTGTVDKPAPDCPECGAELVVQTGKYGPFLGCSRYPECNYTRKR